jgi:hypothetical protein
LLEFNPLNFKNKEKEKIIKKLLILVSFTLFMTHGLAADIYQNAIGSSSRPIKDKPADIGRKPEKTLRFF